MRGSSGIALSSAHTSILPALRLEIYQDRTRSRGPGSLQKHGSAEDILVGVLAGLRELYLWEYLVDFFQFLLLSPWGALELTRPAMYIFRSQTWYLQ